VQDRTEREGARVPHPLLLEMCRRIFHARCFDEAAIELVASGEVPGSVHSSIGQEASAVGACMALLTTDYMTGTHRSHAHLIGKGVPLGPLMAEILGKDGGVCRGFGGSMHAAHHAAGCLGASGIVGSSIPIATGAGLSAALLGEDRVVLSFLGEGASNQGAFHESLNLAAVWKLPVVYVCENNLYAVSTPASEVVAVTRVARRAESYAIPGQTVDGQDPLAVYDAVSVAVARARRGEGPSLIETETYRYGEHTERLKIGLGYRTEAEIAEWRKRDPVVTFPTHLAEMGVITDSEADQLLADAQHDVDEAVAFARSSPYPSPELLDQYLFTTPQH
jgi:TPP-dependent pyruvate/acetoin dehydrogenase alpha subunit